jgi:hypothetical protein
MVLIINAWRPDTCSCILHFSWDDSVPQDQRVRRFFAVENVCPAHQNLIGLSKGEPDWEQPDRTVESENTARFAIVGDALDRNESRNIDPVTNLGIKNELQRQLNKHNQDVINRYATIFEITNDRAISKGIWNAIEEENDRKNAALRISLAAAPTTLFNVVGSDRVLKDTVNYNFTWTGTAPNRILNISFTGVTLTTAQKNTIRTQLDSRIGVGKVVLS